ncbi:ubiquinone biosynthesis protein UbiJ [Polynucleobacter meluiroseus]|jgi:ubiquinone biosynthesis accessory factor UbiJ|uniref:Ubiquinone biosynthesis accessory factor UbiJ n=1 Tax=Polynucleobacter meluiroseus TaxID=1938814 RepID=A0A240DXD8_9BURK|nr:SCP2 sterol-binding domain-containing protein [Polynucleobacter meluiroseus]SNX27859.1 ubiquinone biosynthesis protein UbiJ [Polynucleobacter meluiroseus]
MSTDTLPGHTIAADAVCRGINHVLASEPWAMAELARHANKTILLKLPVGNLGVQLSDQGLLKVAADNENPSLILDVSAQALSELIGGPGNLREQAFKAVRITGDADLAQLLGRLAGQVRWDYEEDLARMVGDAQAHLTVREGKKLLKAGQAAAQDFLGNVIEYLTEENQVLLNKRDLMARKVELNDLRDAVDRIEKRIQLLEKKAS